MDAAISNATLKALRRILRAVDGGSRKLAAATGLTPSQLLVLREVEAGSGVTPGSVAQRLQFSHATITAIADRLVTLGLITRTRSDQDKRQMVLAVTDEGRQRLADAPDMLQQIFAARFAALAGWEQAMILAGAERLAEMLGASDLDAAPLLDAGLIDRSGSQEPD
ncbi:MAG: MarR family transcriptional regulator [Sphingopyxis sp.]|uniref:MarR family winged helix-turn-helix transcriptional regulator n=1 Tax=Sphingopyxis sp. TaxID=1908224 RepID=UPI003D80C2A2